MNGIMKLSQTDYIRMVKYINKNYGINLDKKQHLIEGRLVNLIQEKGFHSFEEYFNYVLSGDSKEDLAVLVNKLTTNHTYFMREKEHFEFFEGIVLPWIREEAADRDIRIWSAGCSSGEEPYTLAMIIKHFLGSKEKGYDKKILATDINHEVLIRAINGIYRKQEVEDLPNVFQQEFFTKINQTQYQVKESLKSEVIFRIFNLMDEFPFRRKFHVIFCRNVMIYFDHAVKKNLVQKFYNMTERGGYLFIGMSESLERKELPYEYVMPSVYRKG